LAFLLAGRLMGVFSQIVLPLIIIVHDIGQHFFACGTITPQFIGDDSAGCITQALQQLTKEALSRALVTVFLHKNIQYIAILIDSALKIMAPATDRDKNLIHVPCVTRARPAALNFLGALVTELEAPLPHRFIGDNNAACSQ
jgi:hypothetical protein